MTGGLLRSSARLLRRFSMLIMITFSLLLNIVVRAPLCAGLITNASWARRTYGDAAAARGILISVYLAIGLDSALLLLLDEPK